MASQKSENIGKKEGPNLHRQRPTIGRYRYISPHGTRVLTGSQETANSETLRDMSSDCFFIRLPCCIFSASETCILMERMPGIGTLIFRPVPEHSHAVQHNFRRSPVVPSMDENVSRPSTGSVYSHAVRHDFRAQAFPVVPSMDENVSRP